MPKSKVKTKAPELPNMPERTDAEKKGQEVLLLRGRIADIKTDIETLMPEVMMAMRSENRRVLRVDDVNGITYKFEITEKEEKLKLAKDK